MNNDILIKVDKVSKKYCRDLKASLWYGVKDLTKELTGRKKEEQIQLRDKEFWALKDISFEVRRGECLGLIGRNGAGKSTLLKMLNGLIKPDHGRIEMRGRVGALIELGAGFNPILTGRENIFNNAAILGFSKEETKRRLDDIIEFSELGEFLDTPVQFYSSGMRVRLGFSIASQMEPDILLIDEVLAVGDLGFVMKCFNRMDKLMQNTTLVFVSHNMPMVSRICTNLMVLKNGKSVYQSDDIPRGISTYYNQFDIQPGKYINSEVAMLEFVSFSSSKSSTSDEGFFEIEQGDDLKMTIKIKLYRTVLNPKIMIAFLDKEQRAFGEILNFQDQIELEKIDGEIYVSANLEKIQFSQGIYSVTITLLEAKDRQRNYILKIQAAAYFKVVSNNPGWAPVHFTPTWELLNS